MWYSYYIQYIQKSNTQMLGNNRKVISAEKYPIYFTGRGGESRIKIDWDFKGEDFRAMGLKHIQVISMEVRQFYCICLYLHI